MNAEQAQAVRRAISQADDSIRRYELLTPRGSYETIIAQLQVERTALLEGLNVDFQGSSRYRDALNAYTDVLRDALRLAEDGFKAPELSVYKIRDVQAAAWEVQVQYAAMMRESDEKREQE